MKKITAVLLALVMALAVFALAACQPAEQNVKQKLIADLKEYQQINLNEKVDSSSLLGAAYNAQLKITEFTAGGEENLLPSGLTLGYSSVTDINGAKQNITFGLGDDVLKLDAIMGTDSKMYIQLDGKSEFFSYSTLESTDFGTDINTAFDAKTDLQPIYDAILKYAIAFAEAIPDTAIDTEDGYSIKINEADIKTILSTVIDTFKADEETKELIIKYIGQEDYDSFIAELDTEDIDLGEFELTVKETEADGAAVTTVAFECDGAQLEIVSTEKGDESTVTVKFTDEDESSFEATYGKKGAEGEEQCEFSLKSEDMNISFSSDKKADKTELELDISEAFTLNYSRDKALINAKMLMVDENGEKSEILSIVSSSKTEGDIITAETTVSISSGGVIIPAEIKTTINTKDSTLSGTLDLEALGLKAEFSASQSESTEKVTIPESATEIIDETGEGTMAFMEAFQEMLEEHPDIAALFSLFSGNKGDAEPDTEF